MDVSAEVLSAPAVVFVYSAPDYSHSFDCDDARRSCGLAAVWRPEKIARSLVVLMMMTSGDVFARVRRWCGNFLVPGRQGAGRTARGGGGKAYPRCGRPDGGGGAWWPYLCFLSGV